MNRAAADYRRIYKDISGSLALAATDGDQTLVTGKTGFTIFIQRVSFYVTTDAAQSLAFEDNNGTAKKVFEVPTSPGDETLWGAEFGARGIPLTEGKNFVANVSAAGLAGQIVWEGYLRQTSAISVEAAASA